MKTDKLYIAVLTSFSRYFRFNKSNLVISFVIISYLSSNLYAQENNHALNFDGVNDYVNMNNVLNNLSFPFTAETWVYWKGASRRNGIITSDNDPQFYYHGFWILVNPSGSLEVFLGNGGIAANFSRRNKTSPANALPVNQWAHIAVVVRGLTNMSIYINGIDVGGTYAGSGGNMQSSSHPFVIGRWTYNQSTGEDYFFNGFIDEVRIWRRERTQPQILSTMNQTLCPEYYSTLDSGLVGYWRLDSLENLGISGGGVDDVRDLSFDPHHGDIVNGPIIAPGASILDCSAGLPISLNIKILMQGLYNPETNLLARKDTMSVYLRYASFPFSYLDTAVGIIDSVTHSGLFHFYNAPSGTYYLSTKHLNCIETWSRAGGEELIRGGSAYNYDFTTAASQAYGDNQILMGSKYCIYSGDVNQDGFIDGSDFSLVDNDAYISLSGYTSTDLTGDFFVDGSDLLLVDNNSAAFVSVMTPLIAHRY